MSKDNQEIIDNAKVARFFGKITSKEFYDAVKLALQNEADNAILSKYVQNEADDLLNRSQPLESR